MNAMRSVWSYVYCCAIMNASDGDGEKKEQKENY